MNKMQLDILVIEDVSNAMLFHSGEPFTTRVIVKVNQQWIEAKEHGKDARKELQDKIIEFCLYLEKQRGRPYKTCPYYKHIIDVIYTYLDIDIPRDVFSGDIVEAIDVAELEVISIIVSSERREGIKALISDRLNNCDDIV